MHELYTIVGVALFVMGLLGVILQAHFIEKLVALNIFTSGIFLIFIAKTSNGMQASSIATALVLTGLVVTLAATALAIMLIRAWYKRKKQ